MDEQIHVGERIAHYRRRRGLTQVVLSGLVGRSPSWLVKIEAGDRTVEAIKDLYALARVLKIEPGDLIGGLRLPPNGGAPHDPPQGIPAIRHALFAPCPPDLEPPTANELRAKVAQAKRLNGSGSYEALGIILPELLALTHAGVAQGVPAASWHLSGACQVVSSLACTVGEMELALLAGDRAVTTAWSSGDELLVATAQCHLASAMLRQGWLDEAGAVCVNAVDAIAPTDHTAPEGWSIAGLLQLVASIISVRAGDTAYARRLLREARDAAERVSPGHNDYWDSIGLANVGAHEVSVALESGDAVEALRIADEVEAEELQNAERRASFCVYVAHAHMLRRDDAAATAVLLEAERHSRETVRYSVLAREIVRVCLGRERRSRTPGLRGLAQRIGIN